MSQETDDFIELYNPALNFCYKKLHNIVYHSLKLASASLSYGVKVFEDVLTNSKWPSITKVSSAK